jgi:hypothetical protein
MLRGSSDIDVTITLEDHKDKSILYNLLRKGMEMPECFKSDKVNFSDPITFKTSFSEMSNIDITSKADPTLKREV